MIGRMSLKAQALPWRYIIPRLISLSIFPYNSLKIVTCMAPEED
jgi:hypothetical protein